MKNIYLPIIDKGFYDSKRKKYVLDLVSVNGHEISNGKRFNAVSGKAILSHIKETVSQLREDEGYNPVGQTFNGDILFAHIVNSLGEYNVRKLIDSNGRFVESKNNSTHYRRTGFNKMVIIDSDYGDIDYYSYRIEWLEGHSLTLQWPVKIEGDKIKWSTKFTIYECKQLFGSTLGELAMSTLENGDDYKDLFEKSDNRDANPVKTKAERLEEMEEVRSDLSKEIGIFRSAVFAFYKKASTEYPGLPVGLSGPGKLADSWVKNLINKGENIEDGDNLAYHFTPRIYKKVNDAYFGGWFETYAHGIISKPVYEYDISSAYPSVIKDLESIDKDSEWSYWERDDQDKPSKADLDRMVEEGAYVWVGVTVPNGCADPKVGSLPFRMDNSMSTVVRPVSFSYAFHFYEEVKKAEETGFLVKGFDFRGNPIEWVMNDVLVIWPNKGDKPFRSIKDLYEDRIREGKKTIGGMVKKLTINSVYGKIAQSVGIPKYANPFYAGIITARTRVKIMDAIGSHPGGFDSLMAVQTDAVFFDSPHPSLDLTPNKLGAWEEKVFPNFWIVQPGLYGDWENKIDEDGDLFHGFGSNLKTRGISPADLRKAWINNNGLLTQLEKYRDTKEWDHDWFQTIEGRLSMKSIKQAYSEGRPEEAGMFVVGTNGVSENESVINTNLLSKRKNVHFSDEKGYFISMAPSVFDVPNDNYSDSITFEIVSAEKTSIVGGLIFTGEDLNPVVQEDIMEDLMEDNHDEDDMFDWFDDEEETLEVESPSVYRGVAGALEGNGDTIGLSSEQKLNGVIWALGHLDFLESLEFAISENEQARVMGDYLARKGVETPMEWDKVVDHLVEEISYKDMVIYEKDIEIRELQKSRNLLNRELFKLQMEHLDLQRYGIGEWALKEKHHSPETNNIRHVTSLSRVLNNIEQI